MKLIANNYKANETFKFLRQGLDLTQEELAKNIKASKSSIEKYEYGTVNYTFETLLKIAEKYNLRAGMGMAFVQTGHLKRIFVIANELEEKGTFEEYIIINPKIISQSEELIYVGEGEGCLSVNREVEGIVPRHARITVEYYDYEGNKKTMRAREDLAVAFQHEIDHLNGILFTDKIDPKDPYKDANKMREI